MRNHGSLYGGKDLSALMRQQFAADIEQERRKLDQYQSVNHASINAEQEARGAQVKWGQEESDTAAFARGASPYQSFEDISPAADLGVLAPTIPPSPASRPAPIAPPPPMSRPVQMTGPVPIPVRVPVPDSADSPTTPGVGAPLPSPLPGQAPIVFTGGAAAPDVIYKNGASTSASSNTAPRESAGRLPNRCQLMPSGDVASPM